MRVRLPAIALLGALVAVLAAASVAAWAAGTRAPHGRVQCNVTEWCDVATQMCVGTVPRDLTVTQWRTNTHCVPLDEREPGCAREQSGLVRCMRSQ